VSGGTTLDNGAVERLLEAARDEDGHVVLVDANFEDATFVGDISFDDVVFEGTAAFSRARFRDGSASFFDATFRGPAEFTGTVFDGNVWFMRAAFEQRAAFEEARFLGDQVSFQVASLAAGATFDDAELRTTIVGFESARVGGGLSFRDATFTRGGSWVLPAAEDVFMAETTFDERVELRFETPLAFLRSADFRRGATIRMSGGDINLAETSFGAPCVVSSVGDERARVVSVERADVANLVLADVDLTECRFHGAHHLDELRLEEVVFLPAPPRSSARQTLFEEAQWRRGEAGALQPEAIAPLYRALRKGLEDSRDEPGAADFYYGEMEMRRHAAVVRTVAGARTKSRSEHVVLTLYWLVAGYGLRASRALAALAATIVVFSLLLWWVGFDPDQPFVRTLFFTAESTSSFFRVPAVPDSALTYAGEAMQMIVRVLGPLFLGLALLSLRGRVRR
jgi:uncharacterized protein YjbI with pentapeptide repeats